MKQDIHFNIKLGKKKQTPLLCYQLKYKSNQLMRHAI